MHLTNDRIRQLALDLLRADYEERVIQILKDAGLWNNRDLWRLYGDKEGNFAQAGNQSSLGEAALVEKIVNCVDARFMCECHLRGINPESEGAPHSVRDAVAVFFENRRATDDEAGTLTTWPSPKRTAESRSITIAATGDRPTRGRKTRRMCLTIADVGEGQSPPRLPDTILSLNAKNKQRIRFVQGKFNMGGSGALRFCGVHGLQLVISRRHPALRDKTVPRADEWAITVVRREEPSNKSGEPIHSEFTYLAPIAADAHPRRGEVLGFTADALPLMPEHDEPYKREIAWGTAIKLYEYETRTGQSNVLMKDGLLFALERLLPEIALPVRLHECRGYEGVKERSFETTLAGLVVRLEDGRGDNLEPGFPLSAQIQTAGMNMKARVYAFKEDKAATYLRDEGVIFAINGQAHGHLGTTVFTRPKAVGLPRLKDSLLVLIDCSSLSARQREDLFMSSRDRLSDNAIRYDLEREIEELLRNNTELRYLQNKRRQDDIESKLSDEKPLEDVLRKVLKASPSLNTLLLRGQRLPRPFAASGPKDGSDGGTGQQPRSFIGVRHPTYFKFEHLDYGRQYARNCQLGRRCRIAFVTDAENGYFDRPSDRGSFTLEVLDASREMSPPSYSLTLESGTAHLNMALPPEAEEGDYVVVQTSVTDPTLNDPFVNVVKLTVEPRHGIGGTPGKRKHRPGSGAGDKTSARGISLPKVIVVREDDAYWRKYKFTPEVACHVISDPVTDDDGPRVEHAFYINASNSALLTEMKYSKQDVRLLEAKFKYGNVLLGLAMLHGEDGTTPDEPSDDGPDNGATKQSVQDRIREVSAAVAPVLLPMIDQLSGLSEGDLEMLGGLGDDD